MQKLFPDWTYTEDLQALRDKVEARARKAAEENQPVPRYDDWRDVFSRAAYNAAVIRRDASRGHSNN